MVPTKVFREGITTSQERLDVEWMSYKRRTREGNKHENISQHDSKPIAVACNIITVKSLSMEKKWKKKWILKPKEGKGNNLETGSCNLHMRLEIV